MPCRAVWTTPGGRARTVESVLQPADPVRVHLVDPVWSPLPDGTHSELLGFEELCRSLYSGRRLAERAGVAVPAAARLSGAPAHTASMGMALAAAGCRLAMIDVEPGSRPAGIPAVFWWKLPDGKRLLLWYREVKGTELLPPAGWPWGEWAAIVRHETEPGPRDADVTGQVDWIRKHFDSPTWRTGRLEDFGAALVRRHGRELPVIDKEFTDWSACAAAGQTRAVATARHNREHLASAEAMSTLSAWSGKGSVHAGLRHGSDRAIMLFNTLNWARGGVVRVRGTKLPAGEFELVDAHTGGTVAYERNPAGIEFVAPLVPACGHLRLDLRRVAQRNRPGAPAEWNERHLTLNTNETTLQFHTAGGLCRWHDRRHSMQWCSGTADHPTGAFLYETPGNQRLQTFARRVGPRIADVYPQITERARLCPQLAQMTPPRTDARVRTEVTGVYSRITVEGANPARQPAGERSGDARRWRLVYTLYHGRPELYVNLRLFGKTATNGAEAGYAFFPFAIAKPYVLVDRIAHLTTPADDLAAGMNAGHLAVHHGVRVEGDHAGMNFYPLDTPLIAFESPGAWRYERRGAYREATIYATLFAHCGGADQRQAGDYSFDFVLHPTANDGWDGGLAKGGMEYFRPLLATVTRGRADGRGSGWPAVPAASWLAIDPAAVQLVALKPADFEAGTVMRLWNSRLEPVEARLRLPAARRKDELWRCDLLERATGRVPVSRAGEVRLKLEPHEITTLWLRPG